MFLILLVIGLFALSLTSLYLYRDRANQLQAANAQLVELQNVQQALALSQQDMATLQQSIIMAKTDPVTQLMSWQVFLEHVQQQLNESQRYEFTLGMLVVEIVDWTLYRDVLGAETTEIILREIAQRFQSCIRQVDSMSRASNNHFYLMLSKLNQPEMAAIVAQRLVQALEQPIVVDTHALSLQARIGIAIYPADGQRASDIFNHAEQALKMVTDKAGQSYQFYQHRFHELSQQALALMMGLQGETLLQEIEIYFQPVMNTQTNTIAMMQTRMHWRHAELGLINMESLLKSADKQGKSNRLIEWLMEQACQQYLKSESWRANEAVLCVPLLVQQLKNNHFIYRLTQKLQSIGFPTNKLMFNLIDDGAVNFESIEKSLSMLRYLHINLGLHAFDASGLSIQLWREIEFQYYFTSEYILRAIAANQNSASLVSALLTLANALTAKIVFSDVASEKEAQTLQSLGGVLMHGTAIESAETISSP